MFSRILNGAISTTMILAALVSLGGCQDKYERLPEATAKEIEALSERYKAFLEEAKQLQGKDSLGLLNHFSHAALTMTAPESFKSQSKAFIARVASGEAEKIEIKGARSPGKVRVLLVTTPEGDGVIPFVQTAEGWKIDEVGPAFGDFSKEVNLKGNMPATPPSVLASLVVLKNPQASEYDRVLAAIELAGSKDQKMAEEFAAGEKKPWAKTALLYAAWKAGASCEPFAKAFPIDGESQKNLYDSDTDSYRKLVAALCECAAEAKNYSVALKVYKGCYMVEGGPRSEYVDPIVALANKKPEYILAASLKANYQYEQDPAAHIVVGAIHGEKDMAFHQFIHAKARGGGRAARLAKDWVEKMAELDIKEPPGTHDSEKPAE